MDKGKKLKKSKKGRSNFDTSSADETQATSSKSIVDEIESEVSSGSEGSGIEWTQSEEIIYKEPPKLPDGRPRCNMILDYAVHNMFKENTPGFYITMHKETFLEKLNSMYRNDASIQLQDEVS